MSTLARIADVGSDITTAVTLAVIIAGGLALLVIVVRDSWMRAGQTIDRGIALVEPEDGGE